MTWDNIVGHDATVKAFQHAHDKGRLAHAYLFCGPQGVGKSLVARGLAQAILCECRQEGDPFVGCGTCPACRQVQADSHPDYTYAIRPEESLEFPIELMREVCQGFLLKSVRGHGKVVVIDDADDLNVESANCFLKTLEEPPPRSMLILIGSSPERQLETIVSRCQVIRFQPLSEERVALLLEANGIADATQRKRLAHLGEGSPGLALALADPSLWEIRNELLSGMLASKIDVIGLSQTWQTYLEAGGKESALQRNRAKVVLRLLVKFFSDGLAQSVGGTPQHTDDTDADLLARFTQRLGPEQILAVIDRCLDADYHVDRRVQLVLILEGLIDALAQKLAA